MADWGGMGTGVRNMINANTTVLRKRQGRFDTHQKDKKHRSRDWHDAATGQDMLTATRAVKGKERDSF